MGGRIELRANGGLEYKAREQEEDNKWETVGKGKMEEVDGEGREKRGRG